MTSISWDNVVHPRVGAYTPCQPLISWAQHLIYIIKLSKPSCRPNMQYYIHNIWYNMHWNVTLCCKYTYRRNIYVDYWPLWDKNCYSCQAAKFSLKLLDSSFSRFNYIRFSAQYTSYIYIVNNGSQIPVFTIHYLYLPSLPCRAVWLPASEHWIFP